MIAANVAAASELAEAREPCLYRVHDKPDPTRLEALAQFLEHLGVPWSRTAKQPGDFTRLLQALAEHDMREMVSSFVLRSQAQAVYSPQNIGHFGLNLKRYAHFTSPIRRYSDLVVHRALIRQLGLGKDGLAPDVGEAQLASLGEHLSRTERRAMEAERRAFERLVAQFMADRVGAVFPARVTTRRLFRPVRHPGRDRCRGPGPGLDPGRRRLPCSTSATRPWSASAPARPSRSATGSRSSWSRPTRSRARSCSASTRTSPATGPSSPAPPGRRAGRARAPAARAPAASGRRRRRR